MRQGRRKRRKGRWKWENKDRKSQLSFQVMWEYGTRKALQRTVTIRTVVIVVVVVVVKQTCPWT
jgi:hypothetical protein